tara:strand:+ start:17866 stop:18015 length:150 start_codon:yes stop_codon:yes gene_type:complete
LVVGAGAGAGADTTRLVTLIELDREADNGLLKEDMKYICGIIYTIAIFY